MRIAFASDSAYPWFNGGIEKRRYIIMKRLAEEGHDVHCFTMHRKSMPGQTFTHRGIKYHSVGEALGWSGMYRGGSKRRSIRMPLIFSLQLFWKILPYRFDAVDADNFPFLHLFPLFIYSKLRGVRFAITWHEVWSAEFWRKYLSGLGMIGYLVEWVSARMADVHIANTTTTRGLLESELNVDPRSILVFPVAVDSDEMRRYAKIRHRKKNQFLVVSRLVGHKRVELAIEAVAQTKAKLLIVGTGPDEEKLRALADGMAPGQVSFASGLSIEQHYRNFLESKALIMPSAREGLSLVTVEALALGLPVVVANTTSLPREVKSMCLETREDQLGSLLRKILADDGRYAAEAMRIREDVLSRFSGDSAGKVYARVARD